MLKGGGLDCLDPTFETTGQCSLKVDIHKWVPKTAKAVQLLVKAKTWTMPGKVNSCQFDANVRAYATVNNNHFIHTEVEGLDLKQNRRVTYSTVSTKIWNDAIEIETRRRITGKCNIEIVVYLEGYWE